MNVGELKKLLIGVPDHYEVTLEINDIGSAFLLERFHKAKGIRGALGLWADRVPADLQDKRAVHTWTSHGYAAKWKHRANDGEFRISNGGSGAWIGEDGQRPIEVDSSPSDGTQLQLPAGRGIVKL